MKSADVLGVALRVAQLPECLHDRAKVHLPSRWSSEEENLSAGARRRGLAGVRSEPKGVAGTSRAVEQILPSVVDLRSRIWARRCGEYGVAAADGGVESEEDLGTGIVAGDPHQSREQVEDPLGGASRS